MSRAYDKPPATGKIDLTDRDILWIRAVHRFRMITTDQAGMLANAASRTKMNYRLRQLWAHDYLDRPESGRNLERGEKRPVVHLLGQRGAEWLEENDGVRFPRGKGWKTANQLKSTERIGHQIGLVDTVLRFNQDVEDTPGLRISHQDELIAEVEWPKRLRSYRLPTQIEEHGVTKPRATDPDYTFCLSQDFPDGKPRRSLCFLEWDNSSEDFIKANKLASSIAQKHRCYADAYQRKLQQELYGFKGMRVLWVVKGTEDRLLKMIDTMHRVVTDRTPHTIFWYALHDDLMKHGALGDIWRTGDGEVRPLIVPQT